LGVKSESDTLPDMLHSITTNFANVNLYTLTIGIVSIAFLFWVRKQLKPLLVRFGIKTGTADLLAKAGPVLVIVISILAVISFDLAAKGVKLVGVIPSGMPPFAMPVFDYKLWSSLLPAAVLISLVGFVESISIAQTLAAKRRQRIVPNQELVSLGMSNFAAAMSGGFPVTGGFARSVVNYDAGAETPLAGAFTAVGILAATFFLTPMFQYLPQAVLAATIMVAVLSLVDASAILRTFKYSKMDFSSMFATIVCVLVVGVETGILVGVSLSLLLFLWRTSQPHVAIVGLVPGTEHFRNVDRYDVITHPSILTLRIDESLYFANAGYLEDKIYEQISLRPEVKHVILMCSAVNLIDASALESLSAISHHLNSSGVNFHLSEVKGPVMDSLKRSDFFEEFKGKVFRSQFEGVNSLITI
jgi:SulP family sulfate permease